ncbi:hypothetical protein FB567DRAFT_541805 [Paraphoma chrysanthemicola]|uniref:ADF-H domain-containing protein n=1 Tax=Paraphoma chrysanthemicola TaxID=798071 RepID=A0A8K0VRH5_9PLEO|nr:hypothetical protein FB567DRAFT_541805 [Paraphoma chrysanthemicola]
MADYSFVTPAIFEAFAKFESDKSALALPLERTHDVLHALPAIHHNDSDVSDQSVLNTLNDILDGRRCLYLFVRRPDSIVAITYVPFLAKDEHRSFFLKHRQQLVQQLGAEYFSLSLICKEAGEITDARSWHERMGEELECHGDKKVAVEGEICKDGGCESTAFKDLGYKRNKCRLCDRRMKNKITPEAVDALDILKLPGSLVQMHVDITSETLTLTQSTTNISPTSVSTLLPTTTPTFTFYHHPLYQILYFIFNSPDISTVHHRMKHTMAIPGLLVHAEDVGVVVDQKIEIHEPEDLVFEKNDARIGKFRSMFNRKGFEGTEYVYENLEADKKYLDDVQ